MLFEKNIESFSECQPLGIVYFSSCSAPFRGWTGAGTAGAHHDAGLPEIHGQLGNGSCDQDAELGIFYGDSLTGAFTKAGQVRATYPAAEKGNKPGDRYYVADFLASRCSSLFGCSNTVMPSSIDTPCIIYFGAPA